MGSADAIRKTVSRRRRTASSCGRSLALRALFAFAISVIAGCGGDDDGGGGTATSTPVATATATPGATDTSVPSTATATRAATATQAPTNTVTPMTTATDTPAPTDTPTPSPTATEAVPDPTVEGPITGPGAAVLQATLFDLADVGYSQEEYFISGTARAYAKGGDFDSDGFWLAVPAGTTAAYKTRIMVYRPIEAKRFNGSVVVEWLNVSGGLDAAPDWITAHTELIRSGYVWVGVSAQFIGVEGGVSPFPGIELSLKRANPARYGTLSHPTDSFCYDMYAQAGQAIRNPVGIDPLEDLRPRLERVIAVGESQSAFRLVTYINAIHPLSPVYDGFLVHSRGTGGAALSQSPLPALPVAVPARIRTDLGVPVLTFQTETDVISLGSVADRQDDTPLLRLWEVAGTSHADIYTLRNGFRDEGDDPSVAAVVEVADPLPPIIVCDRPVNAGPQHWVLKAAFAALERWVRDGTAPPTAPRLEVTGTPPQLVLDELGNVLGGIRTSYVEAPVAKLSGLGQTGSAFCAIFGTTDCFDDETLTGLYPDRETYVTAINEATDAAVEAGFILEADGDLIKAEAAAAERPAMSCGPE